MTDSYSWRVLFTSSLQTAWHKHPESLLIGSIPMKFCKAIGKPSIPASEQQLVLFVAHKAQTCCHTTVRAYLSATNHSSTWGKEEEARIQGRETANNSVNTASHPASGESGTWKLYVMMWAACCLGFFAFLRCWRAHNRQIIQRYSTQDIHSL